MVAAGNDGDRDLEDVLVYNSGRLRHASVLAKNLFARGNPNPGLEAIVDSIVNLLEADIQRPLPTYRPGIPYDETPTESDSD